MNTQIKAIIGFILVGVIGISGWYFFGIQQEKVEPTAVSKAENSTVSFGTTTLNVVVADTPQARREGLSGRSSIPKNGMLFVFEESNRHGFWMKDMQFSIDIIWLDESGRVVDIKHSALPESYPETFRPQQSASYVLETTAGFAKKYDLEIGDTLKVSGVNKR